MNLFKNTVKIILLIGIVGGISFYLINSRTQSKTILENLGYETSSPEAPKNPNNPELKGNIPQNSDPRRFYK